MFTNARVSRSDFAIAAGSGSAELTSCSCHWHCSASGSGSAFRWRSKCTPRSINRYISSNDRTISRRRSLSLQRTPWRAEYRVPLGCEIRRRGRRGISMYESSNELSLRRDCRLPQNRSVHTQTHVKSSLVHCCTDYSSTATAVPALPAALRGTSTSSAGT
jgi:hypothetical protein